jgi:hypothetical protein
MNSRSPETSTPACTPLQLASSTLHRVASAGGLTAARIWSRRKRRVRPASGAGADFVMAGHAGRVEPVEMREVPIGVEPVVQVPPNDRTQRHDRSAGAADVPQVRVMRLRSQPNTEMAEAVPVRGDRKEQHRFLRDRLRIPSPVEAEANRGAYPAKRDQKVLAGRLDSEQDADTEPDIPLPASTRFAPYPLAGLGSGRGQSLNCQLSDPTWTRTQESTRRSCDFPRSAGRACPWQPMRFCRSEATAGKCQQKLCRRSCCYKGYRIVHVAVAGPAPFGARMVPRRLPGGRCGRWLAPQDP